MHPLDDTLLMFRYSTCKISAIKSTRIYTLSTLPPRYTEVGRTCIACYVSPSMRGISIYPVSTLDIPCISVQIVIVKSNWLRKIFLSWCYFSRHAPTLASSSELPLSYQRFYQKSNIIYTTPVATPVIPIKRPLSQRRCYIL